MGSGQGQQRAARQMKDAADALRAIELQIDREGQTNGFSKASRTIRRAGSGRSLNNVSERLQTAEQSAARLERFKCRGESRSYTTTPTVLIHAQTST